MFEIQYILLKLTALNAGLPIRKSQILDVACKFLLKSLKEFFYKMVKVQSYDKNKSFVLEEEMKLQQQFNSCQEKYRELDRRICLCFFTVSSLYIAVVAFKNDWVSKSTLVRKCFSIVIGPILIAALFCLFLKRNERGYSPILVRLSSNLGRVQDLRRRFESINQCRENNANNIELTASYQNIFKGLFSSSDNISSNTIDIKVLETVHRFNLDFYKDFISKKIHNIEDRDISEISTNLDELESWVLNQLNKRSYFV